MPHLQAKEIQHCTEVVVIHFARRRQPLTCHPPVRTESSKMHLTKSVKLCESMQNETWKRQSQWWI
jgi:hypothetical protein